MDLNEIKKPTAKLYSTQEVADFIGVPYMKVYRMVIDGKIKAIDIAPEGSKKRIFAFRAEDIQAYYDSISDTIAGDKSIDK